MGGKCEHDCVRCHPPDALVERGESHPEVVVLADSLVACAIEGDPWAVLVDGKIVAHRCDGLTGPEHQQIEMTPREAGVLAGYLLELALHAGWRP